MAALPKNRIRSQLIAEALAGSWRKFVPPPGISATELSEVTPLLVKSGAGALAWWRIRDCELAASVVGVQLQNTYRLHSLQAAVHRRNIKMVFTLLRARGIEPVLVKGWNTARLYPEPGLRHYVDIDLCVARDQYEAADRALTSLGAKSPLIDLHRGLGHLEQTSWQDLFERSQLVNLDDMSVRVPCAEDHLRIICVHWLSHGAWQPAGLCDVALSVESRPADFDWQRCLGPDRARASWVACTIGLARQLLGAQVNETPAATLALPRWLVPAVLRQWSSCFSPNYRELALGCLFSRLTRPGDLFQEVRWRWDHPVRATIQLNGAFNNLPRMPFQLAEVVLRSGKEVPRQLLKLVRDGKYAGNTASVNERAGSDIEDPEIDKFKTRWLRRFARNSARSFVRSFAKQPSWQHRQTAVSSTERPE